MKRKITPLVNYLRAHHWGPKGYSTKTFLNQAEAQAWLARKDNEK